MALLAAGAVACSSITGDADSETVKGGRPGDPAGANGANGANGTNGANGGSGSEAGAGSSNEGGTPVVPPSIVGGPCDDSPGGVALPELDNVRAVVRNDSLELAFDGADGARDYRVYALPATGNVSVDGSGVVTIKDATYRCAGDRTAATVTREDAPHVQSAAVRTRVDSMVESFRRTPADATLGYVYTTPGPGRVPVYALGDSREDADNGCYFQRWSASRVKTYTSSDAERSTLLGQRYRDDGVLFYAPTNGAAGTRNVYRSGALYFIDGAEKSARTSPTVAFSVMTTAAPGTRPLKRVYYQNDCGKSHDELAVGEAAFAMIRDQGNQPLPRLHWSGLTGPTTLVVEAVDALCPYQGMFATTARAAGSEDGVTYAPFVTMSDVRASTASREVFINGQGASSNRPKAVARSCVKVAPQPTPAMDFSATFAQPESFAAFQNKGFKIWHSSSTNYDVGFYSVAGDWYSAGVAEGELWVALADWAADTNGKFRLTPKKQASLANDKFLHVTFEVDSFSTGRRYPQVLISDRMWPVQENMANGSTIVVETIEESPVKLQVQLCDHRTWEVNAQCPSWNLHELGSGAGKFRAPVPELVDQAGRDRMNRYDVYASTGRVYVYFDGAPFGCVDLTPGVMPAAPASVTFGQVLYHSGVDLSSWNTFHEAHEKVVTGRHWDNLGFSSNVAAPAWDDHRFPCVPASARVD